MTDDDIKIEVNKIGVKNRYEKMGQGDDLEDLTDEEIVKELKKLDEERNIEREERKTFRNGDLNLNKVRPTELNQNLGMNPPVEATKKLEAAILMQQEELRRGMKLERE